MKRHPRDSGAAAVEMALVLPLLLLLLCGIIDFGLAFNTRLTLTHAARESVRVWALGGTEAEALARAEEAAPTLDDLQVDPSACDFGAVTSVVVTARHQFIFPFVGTLADDELTAEGVMRCGG